MKHICFQTSFRYWDSMSHPSQGRSRVIPMLGRVTIAARHGFEWHGPVSNTAVESLPGISSCGGDSGGQVSRCFLWAPDKCHTQDLRQAPKCSAGEDHKAGARTRRLGHSVCRSGKSLTGHHQATAQERELQLCSHHAYVVTHRDASGRIGTHRAAFS